MPSERISALLKASIRVPGNKIWARLIHHLGLNRLEHNLFADLDAQAKNDGWQVIRLRHGLARHYRNPRFDLLSSCPDCAGSDSTDSQPCMRCQSSGRIFCGGPCTFITGGAEHV